MNDPAQLAFALLTEHRHDPDSPLPMRELLGRSETEDIDDLHEVIRTLGETLFCSLAICSYFMNEMDKTGPAMTADEHLRHFAARYQQPE